MTEIQGRFIIKTSRAGRSDRRSDGSSEGRRRELKTVVQLFRNEKDVLVHIDAAGEQIQTTLGHPFYVVGKGWVKAGELKSGDVLKLYDGKEAEINGISIKDSKPVTPITLKWKTAIPTMLLKAMCFAIMLVDRTIM